MFSYLYPQLLAKKPQPVFGAAFLKRWHIGSISCSVVYWRFTDLRSLRAEKQCCFRSFCHFPVKQVIENTRSHQVCEFMFGYPPNSLPLLITQTAWSSLMAWIYFFTQDGLRKIFFNSQGTQYWVKPMSSSLSWNTSLFYKNLKTSLCLRSQFFTLSLGPDSCPCEHIEAGVSRTAA